MRFPRLQAAAAAAVTACLLAAAPTALAATSTTKADTFGEDKALNLPTGDPENVQAASGGGLVRTFVGLAIVVAVIYGLYWILRQVKAGREERASGTGLRTTATVPLGPNRALHLVRAGNELVLVGVAESAVTPIRTYTEEEARAAGLLSDDEDVDGDGEGDDTPGTLLVPAPAKRGMRGMRGMTIGEALDRLRQATVRT